MKVLLPFLIFSQITSLSGLPPEQYVTVAFHLLSNSLIA